MRDDLRREIESLRQDFGTVQNDVDALMSQMLGQDDRGAGQAAWRQEWLKNMDPFHFENLIAELWEDIGYETKITPPSQDQGVDVIAESSLFGPIGVERLAIQAKRYGDRSKVSSTAVHRLDGARRRSQYAANAALVVTTSEFTRPAREAGRELGIELIDGQTLVEYLNESSLPPADFV